MFFGKKNQLVGLDIGTSSIKIVEIQDSSNGIVLKKAVKEKIPPDLFSEGEPKDASFLSSLLKDLFIRNKIKNKNVALSIGGASAIVKPIKVSASGDKDLHSLIFEEAEHYIPFDINEVNIDYHIMDSSNDNLNQIDVLLVAVKTDIVQKYVKLVEGAGLNPCIIDIDAFAVQNIFEINEPDVKNAILINVGASKTSLNVVVDNESAFMRSVSMGSSKITEEIMLLDSKLNFEEAEMIKSGESEAQDINPDDFSQLLASVSLEWCSEITRALDFFYSNYDGERAEQIYLCGGGSYIEKFREELSSYSSSDVKILDPLKVFDTEKTGYTQKELKSFSPEFCVALGLGLRKVDDK
ncbi:MAG: pilus assembly protein PilM [Deltaproteobacteria bacterium]|nr:MAG: pilus assembly protein PilM [Deltaproteobacteria bacterium]